MFGELIENGIGSLILVPLYLKIGRRPVMLGTLVMVRIAAFLVVPGLIRTSLPLV